MLLIIATFYKPNIQPKDRKEEKNLIMDISLKKIKIQYNIFPIDMVDDVCPRSVFLLLSSHPHIQIAVLCPNGTNQRGWEKS